MLLTGARVSEACGICWDALDIEQGIARVVRRVRWDYTTKTPFLEDVTKTSGSARLLMLPKRLQDIFLQIKKETINNLVFTDRKGELLRYNAIQSAFNAGFIALSSPGVLLIFAGILTLQWLLWEQIIFLLFKLVLDIRNKQ